MDSLLQETLHLLELENKLQIFQLEKNKKNKRIEILKIEKIYPLFLYKILDLTYQIFTTIDFYIGDDKLFILGILRDCRKKISPNYQ